jgi:hypothetical protein
MKERLRRKIPPPFGEQIFKLIAFHRPESRRLILQLLNSCNS